MTHPRIAIAHDYLTQRGGAERVVLSMLRAFPEAGLHTLMYAPDSTYPEFRDVEIATSPLNRVPAFRSNHRSALPLMAYAASRMRIEADVVLASSSGWAHGFGTDARRLVYCHNPARWLYQTEEYLGASPRRSPQGLAVLALRPALRRWDRAAAAGADTYLANSRVVQERIRRIYGRSAEVVPPPYTIGVGDDREPIPGLDDWSEGYFLVVSRLLPYKNVNRVVAAIEDCPGHRLLVVGDGPEREALIASSPSRQVRFVRGLSDAQMRSAYAGARALIAASYEDFGLTPLEAGAFGVPTLALQAGGYLDTIVDGVNGLFFETPDRRAIAQAIARFEASHFDADVVKRHTETFGEARFHDRLRSEVARITEI